MINRLWRSLNLHPDEECLLLYLDGELKESESRRIEVHLRRCWTCRSAADRLDAAVRSFAESRVALPPREIDIARFRLRLEGEAASHQRRRGTRPLHLAIATAIVVLVAFVATRADPEAQLPEVLARAAERPAPVSDVAVALAPGQSADRKEFSEVLQRNGLNPRDPLSAQALVSWCKSVPLSGDEVAKTKLPDGSAGWQVRAERSGPLSDQQIRAATVLLRASDLVPVRVEYAIHRRGRLIRYTVDRVTETPRQVVRPENPPAPIRIPLSEAEIALAEFEVHYILHRLDACRSDVLELAVTPHHLLVTGVAESEERRKELTAALASVRNVRVEMKTTAELARKWAKAALVTPAEDLELRSSPPLLADLLRQHFRQGRNEVNAQRAVIGFSNHVIRDADAMKTEAWILAQLVSTFDARVIGRLHHGQRLLLEGIMRDHLAALQSDGRDLDALLAQLPVRKLEYEALKDDWGSVAPVERIRKHTSTVSRLAGVLFAGLNLDAGTPEEALTELAACLREIRVLSESFESQMAQMFRPGAQAGVGDAFQPRLP